MSLREDLVKSAVEFLKDPSIRDSPLNKRIEFIESKGLTQEEIQELLKRAQQQDNQQHVSILLSSSSSTTPLINGINNTPIMHDYYPNPPPLPERVWKDYFIMATSTIGVTYGIYQIVTRYLLPNILPPSKSKLEQEKESIDQEFSRIEKLLETLELNQIEFIEENNLKGEKIDETLNSIDNIVLKTNEKNLQNEESLKYLKLEIENIKSTMISTLDSQRSSILQELSNLETELNNLKKIIIQTDLKFDNKADIELKPEEKLDRFKIPPVSSVPSANQILEDDKIPSSQPSSSSSSVPAWQQYADKVQQEASNGGSSSGIPAWQQVAAASTSADTPLLLDSNNGNDDNNNNNNNNEVKSDSTTGIPAWQMRS